MNVEIVDQGTAAASAAASVTKSIVEKQEGFTLVTTYGAVVASVISAVPILKPITLQANTFAVTASFIQLWIHVDDGAPLTDLVTDTLDIVGSVSGIVATGAFLATGGGALMMTAGLVAIAASATSTIIGTGAVNSMFEYGFGMIEQWGPPDGIPATTGDLYMDTGGFFREFQDIIEDPQAEQGMVIIYHKDDWAKSVDILRDENPAPPPPPPDPGEEDPWLNPAYIPMPALTAS